MINHSNSGKDFKIPDDIMEKWQRMVNIMYKLFRMLTGFIIKVNAPNFKSLPQMYPIRISIKLDRIIPGSRLVLLCNNPKMKKK